MTPECERLRKPAGERPVSRLRDEIEVGYRVLQVPARMSSLMMEAQRKHRRLNGPARADGVSNK